MCGYTLPSRGHALILRIALKVFQIRCCPTGPVMGRHPCDEAWLRSSAAA